jgi:hypothetical protein
VKRLSLLAAIAVFAVPGITLAASLTLHLTQARSVTPTHSRRRRITRRPRHVKRTVKHHRATPKATAAQTRAGNRFSLATNPASMSLTQNATGTVRVMTKVTSGSVQTISLFASGLPSGTTARFSAPTVTAGGSSVLALSTSSSTPAGAYTVTVNGTAPGATRSSALISLSVKAATLPTPPTTTTTPTPTPPPTGSVPTHIETWSFDDGCNGGKGASASLVQNWLTYAESNCGAPTKTTSDCHSGGTSYCKAIAYLDANKIYADSVPIAQDAQENWWLHQPGYTDSAHRLVFSDARWGSAQLLNQANPAVDSWFQNYARTNFSSADGLMMDDTGASANEQLYGTGFSSSQEISSDTAMTAAHQQLAASVTHADGSSFTQIDNSVNVNPWLPNPFALLNHPGSVVGLLAEGVPESNGTLTPYYSTLLDDMAYVNYQPNAFIVPLSYDANGSLTSRRVQAASILLGYSPGHEVSWSNLEQSNANLSVWPEEGIYPTQPVQTMGAPAGANCLNGNGQVCSTGGHNDVQVAPGIYRREFKSCFNGGTGFGPCAVIMNDSSGAVAVPSSWLTQSYAHQITMNGGDVQSGGTVDPAGASFTAGVTTVPAGDALLLSS